MKQLFVLSFVMFILACNSNDADKDKSAEAANPPNVDTPSRTPEADVATPVQRCFAKMDKKDTVKLSLSVTIDTLVTGSLVYKLAEKDANKGSLKGALHGDTLIADYTFQSEGTTSVRQVAFLLKDSTATEGFGDVEEKNGQMVFKKGAKLQYGKGLNLKKVDCELNKE